MASGRYPAGYTVKKIYVIICDQCNEDITRPQSGDDVMTAQEAWEYVREHEKIWHAEND